MNPCSQSPHNAAYSTAAHLRVEIVRARVFDSSSAGCTRAAAAHRVPPAAAGNNRTRQPARCITGITRADASTCRVLLPAMEGRIAVYTNCDFKISDFKTSEGGGTKSAQGGQRSLGTDGVGPWRWRQGSSSSLLGTPCLMISEATLIITVYTTDTTPSVTSVTVTSK